MKKIIAIALIASTATTAAYAQAKKKPAARPAETKSATAETTAADGFTKTPNNLEYKIVRDMTEGKKPFSWRLYRAAHQGSRQQYIGWRQHAV